MPVACPHIEGWLHNTNDNARADELRNMVFNPTIELG